MGRSGDWPTRFHRIRCPTRAGVPAGHLALPEIHADFARREAELRRRAATLGLTRREFLHVLAAGAATAAVASAGGASLLAGEAPPPKSRVVVVTHPEVILKGYRANPPTVRLMLDRALLELTGAKNESAAWQAVGREDDFVAVKQNTMGYPTLHSHTELSDAVSAGLTALAKVKAENILVVDRKVPEPYNELSEPFTLPSNGIATRFVGSTPTRPPPSSTSRC